MPTTVSFRDVANWVISLRWPALLDSIETEEDNVWDLCVELVSVPQSEPVAASATGENDVSLDGEYGMYTVWDHLTSTVKMYLLNTLQLLRQESCIALLRRLNSSEVGINRQPFRAIEDDTAIAYSKFYARFIAMLVRAAVMHDYRNFVKFPVGVKECVNALYHELSASNFQEEACINALFGLERAIWTREDLFDFNQDFNCPVYRFIAFTSMDSDGSFSKAGEVSPRIAKMQYFARACVFQCMRTEFQNCGDNQLEARKVLERFRGFVSEEHFNSFARLREIMHLVSNSASIEHNEPQMDWVHGSNYTAISLPDGHIITTKSLGNSYHHYMNELKTKLKFLLMGYPWKKLPTLQDVHVDDINCNQIGYSFLNDPRNVKLINVKKELVKHLSSAEGCKEQFVRSSTTGDGNIWKEIGISQWMGTCSTVVEIILFLVHLSSGQPARGVELMTYNITKPANTSRSVYFNQGTIMLITTYWKGRNVSNRDRPIARFLPKEFAKLLLVYLSVIRPTEVFFSSVSHGNGNTDSVGNYNRYLFVRNGIRMNSEQCSTSFQKLFLQKLRFHLSFRQFRQIVIGFTSKLLQTDYGAIPEPMMDEQAGHGTATAGKFYGRMASEDHSVWNIITKPGSKALG